METQPNKLRTWDVLRSLGFIEDKSVFSDPPGALSFDFGNFKLLAVVCLNRSLYPVILLSGVMATRQTIDLMQDEIPQEVESREQAIALVTWCLDKTADGKFLPQYPVPWLAEGRAYRSLLSWEQERFAFAARPQCEVDRDWMRVLLNKLRRSLSCLPDDAKVTFEFDGEVLKLKASETTFAVPAIGKPWPSRFSVPVVTLQRLPRRLPHAKSCVSIWKDSLLLDRWRYSGVAPIGKDTAQNTD